MPEFNPGDIVLLNRSKAKDLRKRVVKVLPNDSNPIGYYSRTRIVDHRGKQRVIRTWQLSRPEVLRRRFQQNVDISAKNMVIAQQKLKEINETIAIMDSVFPPV